MDRDQVVLRIFDQLLELEQRLIPTGLHVFGRPPTGGKLADMLRAVASFARPEFGGRSLPDLVAHGLGLKDYESILAESGSSAARLAERERIETLVRTAVSMLVTDSVEAAADYLAREAGVSREASSKIFVVLDRIRGELSRNGEVDALVRALRGEYIEPGPGADIVQNPAVLPTGRNTHAINPYAIPSAVAFDKAGKTVAALLNRHLQESGRLPEAIGMVLWGMDNIKTQGEGVAQALRLMGVAPRRDAMNRTSDIEAIPLEQLGRPRIDVVMTVSGIFRDLFGPTVELLDKAARLVAGLDEPPEMNFLRKHAGEQIGEGARFEDAATRVFSNAPGNYGTNVNFMIVDGQWQRPEQIGDLFVTRKCFAYGRSLEGRRARDLLDRALARVEATYQNIDNAEIGITDVDHYFEYLGGLTQAVERRAGKRPKIYLSDEVGPLGKIRSLEEAVRLETRTKTLNPKWYEGMLQHGFSGVAAIEHHVSNTFGWSATAGAVEDWIYDEIAGTYLLDNSMLERLRSANPDATRNLASRLLEAKERGFWNAGQDVVDSLLEILGGLEDQLEGIGAPRP
jgi:magnesium chelatase subunit H